MLTFSQSQSIWQHNLSWQVAPQVLLQLLEQELCSSADIPDYMKI